VNPVSPLRQAVLKYYRASNVPYFYVIRGIILTRLLQKSAQRHNPFIELVLEEYESDWVRIRSEKYLGFVNNRLLKAKEFTPARLAGSQCNRLQKVAP
jgi:hypothetical protein